MVTAFDVSGDFYSGLYGSLWAREYPCDSAFAQDATYEEALRSSSLSPKITVAGQALYLSLPGFVNAPDPWLPWDQVLTYCSRVTKRRRCGVAGPGWFLSELPFLVERQTKDLTYEIGVVGGLAAVAWFVEDGQGAWKSSSGTQTSLKHDTVGRSFTFQESGKPAWKFQSFDHGLPRQIRGTLKQLVVADERRAIIRHTEFDEIREIELPRAEEGRVLVHHEYREATDLSQRLRTTTVLLNGQEQQRITYGYNRLALLETRTLEARAGSTWHRLSTAHFLYGDQVAFEGGCPLLKQVTLSWEHQSSDQRGSIQGPTEYHFGYGEAGKVHWIHKVGDGPEPTYVTRAFP